MRHNRPITENTYFTLEFSAPKKVGYDTDDLQQKVEEVLLPFQQFEYNLTTINCQINSIYSYETANDSPIALVFVKCNGSFASHQITDMDLATNIIETIQHSHNLNIILSSSPGGGIIGTNEVDEK